MQHLVHAPRREPFEAVGDDRLEISPPCGWEGEAAAEHPVGGKAKLHDGEPARLGLPLPIEGAVPDKSPAAGLLVQDEGLTLDHDHRAPPPDDAGKQGVDLHHERVEELSRDPVRDRTRQGNARGRRLPDERETRSRPVGGSGRDTHDLFEGDRSSAALPTPSSSIVVMPPARAAARMRGASGSRRSNSRTSPSTGSASNRPTRPL